jgi:hypothetical protein
MAIVLFASLLGSGIPYPSYHNGFSSFKPNSRIGKEIKGVFSCSPRFPVRIGLEGENSVYLYLTRDAGAQQRPGKADAEYDPNNGQ